MHRAARVASAGHGGQVLLSEATAVRSQTISDRAVEMRQLGAHRLKDLRPERIAQLVIEGLPADFPPIRSLDARPNNLPVELTSFVGRERELDEVRALLASSRLVTLTGPGGTGKTRLALQVAASLADQYPDGTWFVPLGSVADTGLVIPAIARAMGVGDDPSRSPIDVLAAELAPKQALLVLDNLEQVRGAGSDLGELLRRAGKIRLLATSRAPLRISGEQEYPVPGLPTPPDLDRLGPLEREQLPPRSGRGNRRPSPASSLSGCSSPAGARSSRGSRSTPPTPATSPRSSPTWAACRSPSSWPPRESGS